MARFAPERHYFQAHCIIYLYSVRLPLLFFLSRVISSGQWLARAWLYNSSNKAYLYRNDSGDSINLQAQTWPLLSDDILTPDQAMDLVQQVQQRVRVHFCVAMCASVHMCLCAYMRVRDVVLHCLC